MNMAPSEWEVVIEYEDSKQEYNVYATMDRATRGRNFPLYKLYRSKREISKSC